MAITLADAIVFLKGDRSQLQKDLGDSKQETTVWTQAVGTMVGNLMGGILKTGAELAGKAIVGLGKSLVDMTVDAAQVEGVRNTFDNLIQSVGGDAVKAMEDLRFATRGMVSDADLMQAGNKFLAMGLADSSEEMAELSEIATQLGMAMGEDATSSMENFALMMANQSIPRLDSFGISSGKVRERIEELMAATEGLTREEAFNQAVMEQARVTMEKVGEQGETAAAGMASISSTMENLKLKAGQTLQPILDLVVNVASGIVEEWGGKLSDWLEGMQPVIESFAEAFRLLIEGDIDGFFNNLGDALLALGVPQEKVDSLRAVLDTLYSAFQDLKDGNIEEFIGKVKAALVELGVPIEIVDGLEKAFRWVLGAVEDLSAFWNNTFIPVATEVWEQVLKPALEGLWQLITDLKPLFIALGAIILIALVGPMLLAALPVIALGAALIALGLIWKEYGDRVKVILEQVKIIIAHVFGEAINWVMGLLESIAAFGGISILETLGLGQGFMDGLDRAREKLEEFKQARIDALEEMPTEMSTGAQTGMENMGDVLAGIMATLNLQEGNNMTIYGGVQQYGSATGTDSLEELWTQGLAG